MCRPTRPGPDACDDNMQVKAHFTPCPGLTSLPRDHGYYRTHRRIRRDLKALFHRHELGRCPHLGLFWAGSRKWTRYDEREKTLIFVVELRRSDRDKWNDIDAEIREIRDTHGLGGDDPVCIRYYVFHKINTDTDDSEAGDDIGSDNLVNAGTINDASLDGTLARLQGMHITHVSSPSPPNGTAHDVRPRARTRNNDVPTSSSSSQESVIRTAAQPRRQTPYPPNSSILALTPLPATGSLPSLDRASVHRGTSNDASPPHPSEQHSPTQSTQARRTRIPMATHASRPYSVQEQMEVMREFFGDDRLGPDDGLTIYESTTTVNQVVTIGPSYRRTRHTRAQRSRLSRSAASQRSSSVGNARLVAHSLSDHNTQSAVVEEVRPITVRWVSVLETSDGSDPPEWTFDGDMVSNIDRTDHSESD